MSYEYEVKEIIANCIESGDPNSIREIFDIALPYSVHDRLNYLSFFVREMFVMNLCRESTEVEEKSAANPVVSPHLSAKKDPTPTNPHSNPSTSRTSMLGMVTLPRVSDLVEINDNASKGSGSDIPSHSSASSQDELPNEDPLVTEQLWQAALSRDHEAKLFSTHKDFFDSLLKDIGTGRGSSMDWADMVDGLQMGEEGIHDYNPGEDEDSTTNDPEPILQTAAISMQTPAKTKHHTTIDDREAVAPWDLPSSPMETLFRRGYGGLGQSELKDVIDLLEDDAALIQDDEEQQQEEEGVYVGIDDLPVISRPAAAKLLLQAHQQDDIPPTATETTAAVGNSKKQTKKSLLPKKQSNPNHSSATASAGGGPVVVIPHPTTSTTNTVTSGSVSSSRKASLDDSLPLELLSPSAATPTAKHTTTTINKSTSSNAKSSNNNSKKSKQPTAKKPPVMPATTAEAAETILNDHNNNQADDEQDDDIIDLIMTTTTSNKATAVEEEDEADIHHRLSIVQRLKGQANAILNHLNSTSQDDNKEDIKLTGSESLNAMLKQSFEAHVKAYTQPPPSDQQPPPSSSRSPYNSIAEPMPAVYYDYAQDAIIDDKEVEDDDSSYDTQAYHALMQEHKLLSQQQQQQQQQQEVQEDVKPAVIKVKVTTTTSTNAKSSNRRNSDLGPDNKPIRLKDTAATTTTTSSAKQQSAAGVVVATRRPSGSRPRGAIISQQPPPVLKESAEPVIKDARRSSIDSNKRLKDLATPKDIRRRSSINLNNNNNNDVVEAVIKLTRGPSFGSAAGAKSNSRPPSVSAALKASISRAPAAAGISSGVLAGRARSAPRKGVN